MRSCALLLGGALLLSTAAASAQTPPPIAPAPVPAPAPLAPAPGAPPYALQPYALQPNVMQPYAPPPTHQNSGMMIAGIVLTSLGSAMLLATLAMVACCNQQDSDGISIADTLGVIVGLSSILPAAVGIPLWVVGARSPPQSLLVPVQVVPAVSAGPGGVALRWTF
jgi:hypothetical protein